MRSIAATTSPRRARRRGNCSRPCAASCSRRACCRLNDGGAAEAPLNGMPPSRIRDLDLELAYTQQLLACIESGSATSLDAGRDEAAATLASQAHILAWSNHHETTHFPVPRPDGRRVAVWWRRARAGCPSCSGDFVGDGGIQLQLRRHLPDAARP